MAAAAALAETAADLREMEKPDKAGHQGKKKVAGLRNYLARLLNKNKVESAENGGKAHVCRKSKNFRAPGISAIGI